MKSSLYRRATLILKKLKMNIEYKYINENIRNGVTASTMLKSKPPIGMESNGSAGSLVRVKPEKIKIYEFYSAH